MMNERWSVVCELRHRASPFARRRSEDSHRCRVIANAGARAETGVYVNGRQCGNLDRRPVKWTLVRRLGPASAYRFKDAGVSRSTGVMQIPNAFLPLWDRLKAPPPQDSWGWTCLILKKRRSSSSDRRRANLNAGWRSETGVL